MDATLPTAPEWRLVTTAPAVRWTWNGIGADASWSDGTNLIWAEAKNFWFAPIRAETERRARITIGSVTVDYDAWRDSSLLDSWRTRVADDVRATLLAPRRQPRALGQVFFLPDREPVVPEISPDLIGPARPVERLAPPTPAEIFTALRRFTGRRSRDEHEYGSLPWLHELFALLNVPSDEEPMWLHAVDRFASAVAGAVVGFTRQARRASSVVKMLAATARRVLRATAQVTPLSANATPMRSPVAPTAPPALAA